MLHLKKYCWIYLGLLAVLLNLLFTWSTTLYEVIYFKGFFQLFRIAYDHTLGFLPFPAVYILFFLLVYAIAQFLKSIWKKQGETALAMTKRIGLNLLSFTGAVIFFFYFLWGFNYKQYSIEKQWALPEIKPDSVALFEETLLVLDELTQLRRKITTDTASLQKKHLLPGYEGAIRVDLEGLLANYNVPVLGRVRVRELYPKGLLLRISTAGVYIPFVCEGHIDAGLHPIQRPFTLAHEMSHGYGYTDEGTCNFLGYLACELSTDDFVRYSGKLGYWRYLYSNLRTASPAMARNVKSKIDKAVINDLNAIYDEMDKYPDIMPKVRDVVYDSYLKSHGIKQGLANYSDIVRLVMAYKQTKLQ